MEGSVEFRILGPLEVLVDGRQVELGGRNDRALIVTLALHPGQPVSTDAIVEALWGERPPPTAKEMVRTYVARARKRFGDRLQRQPGGYVLALEPLSVDAFRFKRLVDQGRRQRSDNDLTGAARTLRQALALWRGPAAPELNAAPGVSDDVAELEELRLSATQARIDLELSLGHAEELVPELEALIRQDPYRERLRGALMLSLYRSGRQAEALETYLETRRLLVEEIGIEPGRELQELQAAILRQDPSLDAPSSTPALPLEPPVLPEPPHRRRNRRRIPMALGTVIAATAAVAVAVVVVLVVGGSGHPVLRAPGVGVINATSGQIIGSRPVRGGPGPIAVGGRDAWIGDGAIDSVLAIDPGSLRILRVVPVGTFPHQLATDGSRVWVGDGFYGTVTRIDTNGRRTRPFRAESRSTGRLALGYGADSLWIGAQDGTLSQVEPRSDRTLQVIRGIGKPQALAVGAGAIWVAEATSDELLRIPLRGRRTITRVPIGGVANDLAIGDGSVWAATPEEGLLWRINGRSGAVASSIAVGPGFGLVTFAAGRVWAASPAGTLESIDPAQDRVVQTIDTRSGVSGLSADHGSVWVTLA